MEEHSWEQLPIDPYDMQCFLYGANGAIKLLKDCFPIKTTGQMLPGIVEQCLKEARQRPSASRLITDLEVGRRRPPPPSL